MHKNAIGLTAVVITLNEEEQIAGCLESLSFANEIVVVDSGSTDGTVSIAQRYTDRVYSRDWVGFSEQRNFGASLASYDWVLSIDADERVSSRLASEICERLRNTTSAGFRCRVREWMFGGWIDHGGWGAARYLRLYRRSAGQWNGTVHERVKTDGPVEVLVNPIIHLSHSSIAGFVEKMNRYTADQALERRAIGRKPRLWSILPRVVLTFAGRFFYWRGYKDGRRGFILAVLMSIYHAVKELQTWDAWNDMEAAPAVFDTAGKVARPPAAHALNSTFKENKAESIGNTPTISAAR